MRAPDVVHGALHGKHGSHASRVHCEHTADAAMTKETGLPAMAVGAGHPRPNSGQDR